MRKTGRLIFLLAGLWTGALLTLAGCDQTFEPLQHNDRYFYSIFGYLEAGTDTNWVRVVPVGESLFISDVEMDGEVTLEHLESGDRVVMNDKLTSFAPGVNAWNFWSTKELIPENSYLLSARRSDGEVSHVTVTLPPDYPDPDVLIPIARFDEVAPDSTSPDELLIRGVQRLADVVATYHLRDTVTNRDFRFSISHLQDTVSTGLPGEHVVEINPREDMDVLERRLVGFSETVRIFDANRYQFINCQIYVAGANVEYPNFHLMDERIIALPEGVTNIENGVGYLAAIVSKTVPYPSHPWPSKEGLNPDPCPTDPEAPQGFSIRSGKTTP